MGNPVVGRGRFANPGWAVEMRDVEASGKLIAPGLLISYDRGMNLLANAASPLWPFVVLIVCVGFVILAISRLRLHPFLALILAALLAGVMASSLPADPKNPAKGKLLRAVELCTEEFGTTAGKLSIVVGMATLIGMCMMQSGAADKVVRRFLAITGEGRAGLALLAATYFLSIPIFFDTMFMLMVPIAMALAMRTGGNFSLYVLAICGAGVTTHSMTVPHPGPLMVVENLKLDTGISLFAGILVGMIPVGLGWFAMKRIAAANDVPMRETPNAPLSSLRALVDRPESELPSFAASIAPVVLPILLISAASFFEIARHAFGQGKEWAQFAGSGGEEAGWFRQAYHLFEFIGNKNIALMIGGLLSILLLVRQKKLGMEKVSDLMGPPLETAGVIIMITAAGGAFGLMLRNAGVGEAIRHLVAGRSVDLILLSWLVALVLRIAQGSATVAMQTTSAMIYPLLAAAAPSYSPMYVFLAIGFGAFGCSWMNDSGFWVVSRLSGFSERETLRTWTLLLTVLSVIGLVATKLLSVVLPFHP
jgi:GntP family gluconate:H+ symporter